MKKSLLLCGGAILALCLLSACGGGADRGISGEVRQPGQDGQSVPDPNADLSFSQN